MILRSQLVNAAENFALEENLTQVLIPTMSRDIDKQLQLAHKVVDVVDRANRKNCVTQLRYSVEKPESSYAQVRIFARKKEDEKFQQVVYVDYKLKEFIYLLHVMNSVYDNVVTNESICIVLQKTISSVYSLSFFSIRVEMSCNIGGNRNLFLKLKTKLGF